MKTKHALVAMLFLIACHGKGFAQSIAPSILNSAGGSANAGSYIIEFNLGELMAISTASALNLVVTQGTLQPVTNPSVLPITLLRFQGVKKTQYNELGWSTSYESGNTRFQLQRSTDGRNFSTVYTAPARGLANGSTYNFNDYNPFAGKVFYRLLMTEAGLADKYSQIIVLQTEEKSFWTAYPNPVTQGGIVHLNIQNAGLATTAAISMVDANGRYVLDKKEVIVQGSQIMSLPIVLPPGIYMLSITGFGDNTAQKIIVQ